MRVNNQIAQVNQSFDENVKITSDRGRFSTLEAAQQRSAQVAASDTEDAVIVKEDNRFHVYGTSEIGTLDSTGNQTGQYELHDFEAQVVSFDITQRNQAGERTGGEVRALANNGSATATVATRSAEDGLVTVDSSISNFMSYLNPLDSTGDKVQLQISAEAGVGFGWVGAEAGGSAVANVVRGANGSFSVNFSASAQLGVGVGRKTSQGGAQAEVFGGVSGGRTYNFASIQEVNDFLTHQIRENVPQASYVFPNLQEGPDMSDFGPSRTQTATFAGAGVSGSVKLGNFSVSGGATFTHQSVESNYANGVTSYDTYSTTSISASIGAGNSRVSISGSLTASDIQNSPNPNAIGEFKTLRGDISLTLSSDNRAKIQGGDTDAIRGSLEQIGENLNLRGAGLNRFVNGSLTRVVSAAGNGQSGALTISLAVEAQWRSDDMDLDGSEMQYLRLGVSTSVSGSAGFDAGVAHGSISGAVTLEDWGPNLLSPQ